MKRLRLFTAVPLPGGMEKALAGVISEASAKASGIKWVARDNLHLTLKFFGDQDEASLPKIVELLEKTADANHAFEAEMGGFGGFPDLSKPRVLFVPAIKGQEVLKELVKTMESQFKRAGFELEEKDFHAHATLGRVKEGADTRDVTNFLEEALPASLGAMRVEHFILFQSKLSREGPAYTSLREFPLKG